MNIYLDTSNTKAMTEIMDKYGDSKYTFFGKNENGEDATASIYKDRIVIKTCQHNGWNGINTYWRDGTVEVSFQGRWKE